MLMTQGKQINLNFTVQVRSADKKMFLYTDNNLTAMTEKKAISLSLSLSLSFFLRKRAVEQ
jgi:hypothetical protein